MKSNHVKQALDNTLSSLYVTQKDAYELLVNAKGGVKVKKKLSVALVLSIALLVITAGAVAAVILSSKEFVDQVITPMAEISTTEKWTEDEISSIIQLAEKNGIPVPDAVRDAVVDGEMDKESLILSFVKNDLDHFVGAWSIEDQAWYDELSLRLGFITLRTRFLPEKNEMSENEIIQIVTSHIKNKYDVSSDMMDEKVYQKHISFRIFIDENEIIAPKKWYIYFQSEDSSLDRFEYVVSPSGHIEADLRKPGIHSITGIAAAEDVFDYYRDKYGLHYQWSQEVWEALQQDIKRSVDTFGHTMNYTVYILKQQYGKPDEKSIKMETAIEIAYASISKESGLDKTTLKNSYSHSNGLYLISQNGPVWKIVIVNEHPEDRGKIFDMRYAEVNAYTGEVMNIGHYKVGEGYNPREAFFLMEVLDTSSWPAHG